MTDQEHFHEHLDQIEQQLDEIKIKQVELKNSLNSIAKLFMDYLEDHKPETSPDTTKHQIKAPKGK